jgi:N-acetylglucosaminyl-diphospho-decaprenol L-rhamnosyltransferase
VLSIVIVTHNTQTLVEGLLTSIRNDVSLKPSLREIIVVDNASKDETDCMVSEHFPEVLYLENEVNRGFAAAANQGIARATGDFLLILNSDTLLIPGEAETLLSYMMGDVTAAIVGPQLVHQDLRPQRSFASAPSLLSEVVPLRISRVRAKSNTDLYSRWRPRRQRGVHAGVLRVRRGERRSDNEGIHLKASRYKAADRVGGSQPPVPRDVESVIGAAMFLRADAMRMLGGFDERFFFFLEETDFCLRARKYGYRVVFFPGARIIHLQGRTVRQAWIRGRIEYAISLYKFIKKYHSGIYYGAFVTVRIMKSILFLCAVTLLPFLLLGRASG